MTGIPRAIIPSTLPRSVLCRYDGRRTKRPKEPNPTQKTAFAETGHPQQSGRHPHKECPPGNDATREEPARESSSDGNPEAQASNELSKTEFGALLGCSAKRTAPPPQTPHSPTTVSRGYDHMPVSRGHV